MRACVCVCVCVHPSFNLYVHVYVRVCVQVSVRACMLDPCEKYTRKVSPHNVFFVIHYTTGIWSQQGDQREISMQKGYNMRASIPIRIYVHTRYTWQIYLWSYSIE